MSKIGLTRLHYKIFDNRLPYIENLKLRSDHGRGPMEMLWVKGAGNLGNQAKNYALGWI
jgi:hypothetical protein